MNKPAAPLWTESFKVHSYEVGANQRATLPTLCHYFQEAAWNHAEQLGVGYNRLRQDQRLWVLSRLLVRVNRYPDWAEIVTVRTWPRAARSVFALRDFQILTAAGHPLAAGTSSWLVLDATTRKPLRAERILAGFSNLSEERALDREAEKLSSAEFPNNPAPQSRMTNYSDLDVNGHANYAWYIGCALDAHPVQFQAQHEPEWLEVNYLGEAVAGQNVRIETSQRAAHEYLQTIWKLDPPEELSRIRIDWRPASEPVNSLRS